MKRVVSTALTVILIFCILPLSVFATENEIIYLDDGSYIIVEMICYNTRASGSISGAKQYTHYSNGGESNWKAVLNGSFTYTGSGATCTSSSMDVTIYDSSWYTISKNAGKSGNKAIGSATIGEKALGVTVTRVPVSLTLSCDANGNLS